MWLRYGECLSASGQLPEAVEAFSKVVDLAPNHLGARVSLSALQQQIGQHDEALQVLSGGVTLQVFFCFFLFFLFALVFPLCSWFIVFSKNELLFFQHVGNVPEKK